MLPIVERAFILHLLSGTALEQVMLMHGIFLQHHVTEHVDMTSTCQQTLSSPVRVCLQLGHSHSDVLQLPAQVLQQSPAGYIQKFASQPLPQLPTAQSIQQQYLQSAAQSSAKSGRKAESSKKHDAHKSSPEVKAEAGGQTALHLPLLRPAPPVLKPFAGLHLHCLVVSMFSVSLKMKHSTGTAS